MAKRKVTKRSGPNIPEEQRGTERCTLRVKRGYLAKLDALVESGKWASRGDLIEAWIDSEEHAPRPAAALDSGR